MGGSGPLKLFAASAQLTTLPTENLLLWLDASDASTVYKDTGGTQVAALGDTLLNVKSKGTVSNMSLRLTSGSLTWNTNALFKGGTVPVFHCAASRGTYAVPRFMNGSTQGTLLIVGKVTNTSSTTVRTAIPSGGNGVRAQ